ncbi:MAG: hypothetical protein WHX93_11265 [bacterium]
MKETRNGASGLVERRTRTRRGADQLLLETIRVHRTLLELLHGKSANLSAALRRLEEMGLDLGRREQDRQVGEALTGGLDAIAKRLLELGIIEQLPRKVKVVKVLGKDGSSFSVGTERVGWEMDLPRVGQRYCVYLDDGRVFRTGEVTEVGQGHFRTGNSVYEIHVLEEDAAGLASTKETSSRPSPRISPREPSTK